MKSCMVLLYYVVIRLEMNGAEGVLMKKKRKGFMKRFVAVFLSAILVVGMFSEMNLMDVRAASVGTITATLTVSIEGWDGVTEPEKTNVEPHWFFAPDYAALMDLRDGRSVEVTEYANVTKRIEGNEIIYTYTWPSDISYVGSNTLIAVTYNSQVSLGDGQIGLDSVASSPWLNYSVRFNLITYLYRFMDGDQQIGAYYHWNGHSNQYIELPETPVKENYRFTGWVKEDGTPVRVNDPSLYYTTNTYPVNLYATWEATGHSHNWGTDWENNADAHWHDCTAADCPVTNDSQKDGYGTHSWDAGTVTKEPTESETGERLYKCTVCDYERIEVIPVVIPGHVHDYGTDWKADDTGHWHECSCGDKADEAPHREGSGIITKEPTETETGIKSYSCVDCGHVIRTEVIPTKEGGGNSGNNPGDDSGNVSGNDQGDNSGNNSGNNPGDDSGNNTGNDQGDNNGGNSGSAPGDNSGNDPGNDGGNSGGGNGGSSAPAQTNSAASGADKAGGVSGSGQRGSEPKTGDTPRIEIYATIAMISGMLYLYFGVMERGMTEAEKKELVSRLIGWAKRGGSFRRGSALVIIFFVLFYYHSIGKQRNINVKELCGE